MNLRDFDFNLPKELIADFPLSERTASKLLCLPKGQALPTHQKFTDFTSLLNPGDLLILNDTKVIPARLFGKKETGGKVELLIEKILNEQMIYAQVRASKSPKINDRLILADDIHFRVIERTNQFYTLVYEEADQSVMELIEKIGEIPLPHYMQRHAQEIDKTRYQTVFAKTRGSVAAPTAGFHFDESIFAALKEKKVQTAFLTLHIGAGTFLPVRTENIAEHKMHAEYIEVSQAVCDLVNATKAQGNRVIAVGTTSLRSLETAAKDGVIKPFYGDTDIFIYPGYEFKCVDALLTNLHIPCSTLLMLVCALGGHQRVMNAYAEAVKNNYRFYSYGDAMWVE